MIVKSLYENKMMPIELLEEAYENNKYLEQLSQNESTPVEILYQLQLDSRYERFVKTNKAFGKHIQQTIERLRKNDNYNIAIVGVNFTNDYIANANVWIKDSNLMILWPHQTLSQAVSIIEPHVLDIYTRYYNEVWSTLASNINIKEKSINQLEKIYRLLQS